MRNSTIGVTLTAVALLAGGCSSTSSSSTGQNSPTNAQPAASSSPSQHPAPLETRTVLTLTPVVSGNEQVNTETIGETIRIIRARLAASGVESEITRQGGSNIVVVLPQKPDQATLDLVRQRGEMRFRVVLFVGPAAPTRVPTSTANKPRTAGQATTAPQSGFPRALVGATTPPTPAGQTANASDLVWITPAIEAAFVALNCANPKSLEMIVDDPDKPMVTCDADGQAKYILGPAEILGSEVANASLGVHQSTGGRTVNEVVLKFNSAGTKSFCDVTSRITSLPSPRNQFGIVLDNQVISAPAAQASLCAGTASITGNFTSASAKIMANQLNLGALPMTLQVQSQTQVSATLSPK